MKYLSLLILFAALYGCSGDEGQSFRKTDEQASRVQQQLKQERLRQINNTQNCRIAERVRLEDGRTTCVYRCPNGRPESETVSRGEQCPSVLNVLVRGN
jgi:hypothetical protein